MINADVLVVGCGLTGSVIARELAEQGKKVTIWERRDHIAGNMYDYVDDHGILVQKYGPHIFHTHQQDLLAYLEKFDTWNPYHFTYYAEIDGKFTPTPFDFQTIDDFYPKEEAEDLKRRIQLAYGAQETAPVLEVMEHSDEKIREYGRFLYEKDYSLYTAKQWGIAPEEIDRSILSRVPLRFYYGTQHFPHPVQVLPTISFTHFFKNLLNHPNITVELNKNALDVLCPKGRKLFLDQEELTIPVYYTGALDELFSCCEGALPYRSLAFEWHYEAEKDSKQISPVVAYPQAEGYTRITEYKKLPVQQVKGTSYAVEYPLQYDPTKEQEPYYPLLTKESKEQYEKYRVLAEKISNLYPCGRLGDFKYYNMDHALERALDLVASLPNN